jgi:hypothetical protein
MNRAIAALTLSCGLANAALAQCNFTRLGYPDFDQRRSALPNNGAMYCVPTSAINVMGYVANHGVPTALGGSHNWQSQSNYDLVSGRLSIMGSLMHTDPFDGTNGGNGTAGLQTYLLAFAPGKFTVSHYYGDYNINPLLFHWVLGHLVNVCYGYYPVSNGLYYRDGGHCITLNGMFDVCNSTYTLRWRDPASDSDNLNTQSVFASKTSAASSQLFVDTNGNFHSRIRLWDLGTSSTTRRYLDSYYAINPLVVLTSGTQVNQLLIHRPVQIAGATPPSTHADIPLTASITQIALDPLQINAFVVTSRIIPREQKVWRHNLANGETTELLTANTTLRIATSRHGDLFVLGDGSVRKFGFAGDNMVQLQETPMTDGADAAAYDDARDELVVVTSAGRLVRYHDDLDAPPIDEPLPTAVLADGSVSIAINESMQKYFICGSNAPTVWVVGLISGAPRLRVDTSFSFPGVPNPEKLQFTDEGTLLLLNNGMIGEFGPGAAGGWVPRQDSILAGLPGQRALAVARSRTNFIAGIHDTPEWRNVLVDEGVPDVPDCNADFNQDGVLNSQDFFDFLGAFFATDPTADYNTDGVVNSQDFFDYLTAFFAGCN